MKKMILTSYLDGLRVATPGESYAGILKYFYPECVTALITYALVSFIDAQFVSHSVSADAYATISVTRTLLHFLTKVAEGISVGVMVLCGLYHGKNDHEGMQTAMGAAVLVTICTGVFVTVVLMTGATQIYTLLGLPTSLLGVGVPYLRCRAIAIFLMFIFFGLTGFVRAIKQNHIAMNSFIVGTIVFICVDYIFIFGKCGFPKLCLYGSACASIVQYATMIVVACMQLVRHLRKEKVCAIKRPTLHATARLYSMSLPVMGDKAILAIAKMILVRYIAPMGSVALSSFGVIQDFTLFAFVPAIACAQVVTFLVSNQLGAGNIIGVKFTIKKVLLVGTVISLAILGFCAWRAEFLISCFDPNRVFFNFAVPAFRILALLFICDVVQVILSGALRGSAQMQVVFRVRLATLLLFCIPVAYGVSQIAFYSDFVRFITIYGSFYVGNGLMALLYIYWLRSGRWQHVTW